MRNQIRREIHCFIAHTTWRGLKRRLLWDHQCPLWNTVLRERYMYPVGLINTGERGIKKAILLTNIRVFFLLKLVLVKSTIPNAKKLWNFSQFWCRKFQIQPPETLYLRYVTCAVVARVFFVLFHHFSQFFFTNVLKDHCWTYDLGKKNHIDNPNISYF